jgi:hypothetical protein
VVHIGGRHHAVFRVVVDQYTLKLISPNNFHYWRWLAFGMMQRNVAHTDKRFIRTCYLLLPSRWKQQVSPKLWYFPIRLQDITLHNSVIFNVNCSLTMPDLIEMFTESKHVDGQTRPAHCALIFCVLCRVQNKNTQLCWRQYLIIYGYTDTAGCLQ